jgi:hypothetical protein
MKATMILRGTLLTHMVLIWLIYGVHLSRFPCSLCWSLIISFFGYALLFIFVSWFLITIIMALSFLRFMEI